MAKYNFENYVEAANSAKTKEELFSVYTKTVNSHGLDKVLLCLATDHRDIGESAGMAYMQNYPEDWMKYYFEKELNKIDPVMIYSLNKIGSYSWDEISKNMPLFKKQKQCLEMGKEAGLYNGICTPLRGPNHAIAGLSLAASEKVDSFDGNIDMIGSYSHHFYVAYRRLGDKSLEKNQVLNLALSGKERDILTWIAKGKSQAEVGIILGMSKHTVNWHTRNIFQKLDVNDSAFAVAKALVYGLIHL